MKKVIRIVILVIGLILLVTGSVYALPYIKSYHQASNFEKEGDKLTSQSKFTQALEIYNKSKKLYDDEIINQKIGSSQQNIIDEKYYQEAYDYLKKDDWDNAYKKFLLVSKNYLYFENAIKMAEYAKEKMDLKNKKDQDDEKVKGVNTKQAMESKMEVITTPTPIPTQNPIITPNPVSVNYIITSPDTTKNNQDDYSYEVPEDSYGIPCWNNTSHCKYNCKDPDNMINAWLSNINFYKSEADGHLRYIDSLNRSLADTVTYSDEYSINLLKKDINSSQQAYEEDMTMVSKKIAQIESSCGTVNP